MEQTEPALVDEVARKLAQFHSLDVPIKRSGNWVFDFIDNNYSEANKLFDLNALYSECNCITLKTYDLLTELEWLKRTVTEVDSPVMFTHSDFRSSNIMVTESDGIVICDYEYSCYSYRGCDFGTIFADWGQSWEEVKTVQEFASDHTLKPFIDAYINELIKLNGEKFREDQRNSVQHILKEGKVFALVSYMFFILLTLKANESVFANIPFDKKKQMVCILFFNPNPILYKFIIIFGLH